MSNIITVPMFDLVVFDTWDAAQASADGSPVWTVCAQGETWWIEPRVTDVAVMGYVVAPKTLEVRP